jgi:hypothetical protein
VKTVKIGWLMTVFLLLVMAGNPALLPAASVVKTTVGQAVLDGGSEKARAEAVFDALGEALSRYLYDDMAASYEFEQQINEKIIKRRKFYVKSYEIQSERTLGDLYQVELRVELQSDLLEQELRKIERRERRHVEHLTLVVLPMSSLGKNLEPIDNGGLRNMALEPTVLQQSLQQELAVYGFSLEVVDTISPDLMSMFVQLLQKDELSGRSEPEAAWFQGLLSGDLIVAIRPGEVSEERIVSLHKSFWRSQAELVFIDTKNDMITHLPTVTAKVINSDYVAGLEKLTQNLTERVQQACLDRLLRDYIVPQESEELLVLQFEGFRRPADFALFKERLQSLRTVKEVSLQALAAGSIELGVRILIPAPLLIKWFNGFSSDDLPFTFTVYPLDETPEHYLIRVNYDPAAGS